MKNEAQTVHFPLKRLAAAQLDLNGGALLKARPRGNVETQISLVPRLHHTFSSVYNTLAALLCQLAATVTRSNASALQKHFSVRPAAPAATVLFLMLHTFWLRAGPQGLDLDGPVGFALRVGDYHALLRRHGDIRL